MRSTVMSSPVNLGVDPALQHDDDAMDDANQFTRVGRIPEHRDAPAGDLGDQRVDVSLGGDVDAAGDIVQRRMEGLVSSHFSSNTFC